jgi:hypothetical protein
MFTEWDLDSVAPSHKKDDQPMLIDINYCLEQGANGVDLLNDDYHRLAGISGSNLSLLAESNRHLDNKKLFNLGDTPALTFGTLLHTFVLEPDSIIDRYVVMPEKFAPKAESGVSMVQAKKDWKEANAEKIVVEAEEFKKAERMATNVSAICGDIIEAGIKERSLFVDIDGIICKCRLDIDLEDVGDDYDLKSITLGNKEFSNATLEAHIKKLKYHWSAAFRNIIRRKLGKPVRHSYLIFCNTGPGHMVRVIQIAPEWIEEAEAEVNDLLDSRRFYLKTNGDNPIVEIDDSKRIYRL